MHVRYAHSIHYVCQEPSYAAGIRMSLPFENANKDVEEACVRCECKLVFKGHKDKVVAVSAAQGVCIVISST